MTWGDVLERYPSWQDKWKTEPQRLVLFRISCQQLLVYNTRVKTKMTGVPDDDRKAFFTVCFAVLGV